jgi:hypothetical protein
MSIMVDKELPHLIQPVAQVVVVCSTCQPRPAAGDRWTMSIMVDKELPHLIQPVAQAWTADRSLVSKRTRQRVCHEWFKVAMVPAQFG